MCVDTTDTLHTVLGWSGINILSLCRDINCGMSVVREMWGELCH